MEREISPESGRAYSPVFRGIALVSILVLLFGGGWAYLSPAAKARAGYIIDDLELAALTKRLNPGKVASESGIETAAATESLVRVAALRGFDPRKVLSAALPQAGEVLGMLALDRDLEDFRNYAGREDASGKFYQGEARVSLTMRPLRSRYEMAYAAAYAALVAFHSVQATDFGTVRQKSPYICAPEDIWLPSEAVLPLSHPFALDLFFKHAGKSGEVEDGPVIRALFGGIVVAAADDWSGGQGEEKYKGGGLSPASGNGIVIYDPASRLYCSYFHLSSVALRTGTIVGAGIAIGRGGNSGMNARKKGHGGHVHLEIFDAARDVSLSSGEILGILKK